MAVTSDPATSHPAREGGERAASHSLASHHSERTSLSTLSSSRLSPRVSPYSLLLLDSLFHLDSPPLSLLEPRFPSRLFPSASNRPSPSISSFESVSRLSLSAPKWLVIWLPNPIKSIFIKYKINIFKIIYIYLNIVNVFILYYLMR